MRSNTDLLFDALNKKKIDINEIRRLVQLDIDWTKTIISKTTFLEHEHTLLHFAAFKHAELVKISHWDAVKIMVRRIDETLRPDENIDSIQYGATIYRAVQDNRADIVRLMLSSTFAQTLSKKSNFTHWHILSGANDRATHQAVRQDYSYILSLLLDFGYPLDEKNGAGDTLKKLALQRGSWNCLKVIAERTKLPQYFTVCNVARLILSMMLENITLEHPGYKEEKIQDMREEIFAELLALPKDEKLRVLKIAKDKNTLLGNYLHYYEQSLWGSIMKPELSTEAIEWRIDAEILALTTKKVRTTTTELYEKFEIDDALGDEGVELAITQKKPESDSSDNDTIESVSLGEDVQVEENDRFEVIKL